MFNKKMILIIVFILLLGILILAFWLPKIEKNDKIINNSAIGTIVIDKGNGTFKSNLGGGGR